MKASSSPYEVYHQEKAKIIHDFDGISNNICTYEQIVYKHTNISPTYLFSLHFSQNKPGDIFSCKKYSTSFQLE